ncbi:MAG: hypothetical protein IJ468_11400 [Lachnospiraceae bacterium]|nr:hypothetical protein [Lachnospiraceae bacterium]
MRDCELVRISYERNKDELYRLCYFYTGNNADAADAMQNALIKLMEYEGTFTSEKHETCWLMKVAVNECEDFRTGKNGKGGER